MKNFKCLFLFLISLNAVCQKRIDVKANDLIGEWKICSQTDKDHYSNSPESDIQLLACWDVNFESNGVLKIVFENGKVEKYTWKIKKQTLKLVSDKEGKTIDDEYLIRFIKTENNFFFLINNKGEYYRLTKWLQ